MKLHGLGLLATFGTALGIGWISVHPPEPSGPPVAGPSPKLRVRPSVAVHGGAPGEALGSQLRAIRDPDQLARAALMLVETLSPEQLADWVLHDRFLPREGMAAEVFRLAALERCLADCPERLLEAAATGYSNQSIRGQALKAVAKRDPRWVLGWMTGRPVETWEHSALDVLADDFPAEVIQRIAEGYREGRSYFAYSGGDAWLFDKIARSQPAQLAESLESLPRLVRLQAEGALASVELEQDPDRGLAKLMARTDGWKVFTFASDAPGSRSRQDELGGMLLEHLDQLPSSWREGLMGSNELVSGTIAERWLDADLEAAGFTSRQASAIRSQALMGMIHRGASEEALAKWQELPEMTDTALQQFLPYLFVADDPAGNEALLATIGDETLREEARGFIGQRDRAENSGPVEPLTAERWAADVREVSPQLMGWGAAPVVVASARTRFEAMEGEERRQAALALGRFPFTRTPAQRELYGEALKVLAEDPPPADPGRPRQDIASRASDHAVALMMRDPGAASNWVDELPPGEVKDAARGELFTRWQDYDPSAARQWWEKVRGGD